jgi:hypothetical protein
VIDTNILSTKETGLPAASQSAAYGPLFFTLGVDLNRGASKAPYAGEHARRIFGLKNQYRDIPPAR